MQALDQKSDFTFVLSNPTDFECVCNAHDSSFLTQKHAKLLQNSQSCSRLKNRLPEIVASPIYSESGILPPV